MIPDQIRSDNELSLLANCNAGSHLVKFYPYEDSLCDAVTIFIGAGLREQEGIIIIATPAHSEAFERCLAAKGFNVPEAKARGQVVFLDAADSLSQFMENGTPSATKFQTLFAKRIEELSSKYSKVRAYGEMVNLLLINGNIAGTLGLENLWNRLIQTHSIRLLCSYLAGDLNDKFSDEVFQKICNLHSHIIQENTDCPELRDSELNCDSESNCESPYESNEETIFYLRQKVKCLENEIDSRNKNELILREAIRHRDQAFPIASHELRTPLTSLKLQIQLLQRLFTKTLKIDVFQKAQKSIDICEYQIDRMIQLTDQILDLAQIQLGRLKLTYDKFELVTFTQETINHFIKLMKSLECPACINLVVIPSDLTITGISDQGRFGQIITNLISNAVKYGNGKPVEVQLSTNEDKSRIKLTVRDFGIGISHENRVKIFDPFEQVTTSSHYPGAGLGLYIVYQIIAELKGTIRVESEINQGSTFILELPIMTSSRSID